ncbi:hypothetical protein M432DRAFT_248740 [Thermoascus aurantiacus ATCC 26904]
MKSASNDTSYYECYDIRHVYAKFPQANKGIVERLGEAISWRRGYFKYREARHNKLAQGLDFGSGKTEIIVQSTVGSSLPQNMKFDRVSRLVLETVDEDERSNTGVSQTFVRNLSSKSGEASMSTITRTVWKWTILMSLLLHDDLS